MSTIVYPLTVYTVDSTVYLPTLLESQTREKTYFVTWTEQTQKGKIIFECILCQLLQQQIQLRFIISVTLNQRQANVLKSSVYRCIYTSLSLFGDFLSPKNRNQKQLPFFNKCKSNLKNFHYTERPLQCIAYCCRYTIQTNWWIRQMHQWIFEQ